MPYEKRQGKPGTVDGNSGPWKLEQPHGVRHPAGGARPEQVRNVFQLCGIKVPPRTRLYNELAGFCAQLCVMGKDSMQRELEALPHNAIIAFDGS